MANPRSMTVYQYNLTVKKTDLDRLRYGRKTDNTRASEVPEFSPWTRDSIMGRVMNFYTCNARHRQLLLPIKVNENEEFFHIIGKLCSAEKLNEQEEHEKFITMNDYHVEAGNIQLKSCWWELAPVALNLFAKQTKPDKIREILNTIFSSVVTSDNQWKYSSREKKAWLTYNSIDELYKIANYFEHIGYVQGRDIFVTYTQNNREPIILIKNFVGERLDNSIPFNAEPERKMQL